MSMLRINIYYMKNFSIFFKGDNIMINKVDLLDLVKLVREEEICEKYIRYLINWNEDRQYRHNEIVCLDNLLKLLQLNEKTYTSGFLFGYSIPQLNKEMDLIKITENCVVNIELKSKKVTEDKIRTQLLQNKHYLRMLDKNIYQFTFLSENKCIYFLNEFEELVCNSNHLLIKVLKECGNPIDIDLNLLYSPANILVSPLNSPENFIDGKYLLTEDQENKKKEILNKLNQSTKDCYIGLTGNAGTGKTLLLYDIAKELSKLGKVLLIHSGLLCDGHEYINKTLFNLEIISAKDAKLLDSDNILEYAYILIDETQRLYESTFKNIINLAEENNKKCIFSFDAKQKLSQSENRYETIESIEILCEKTMYKLSNKIRTNKEIALFITCLMDLTKIKEKKNFPNVHIVFEENEEKAVLLARSLEEQNEYKYISYTPSQYNDRLDYQKSYDSTHRVIGQEFDKICMIITNDFFYEKNKLCCKQHPNPNYIFTKLLYQGLTRVRSELLLIITNKMVLFEILKIFL